MSIHKGWLWVGLMALLLFFAFTSLATAETPDAATPVATTPQPTPSIDRLAPPPTVTSPTQADEGAQLFWLYCMPCHGDQGQGLTDEWRAQYPAEDSNCWQSGCHGGGKDPPEQGFALPTTVPAVIGDGSLARFELLVQVYAYMQLKMPYNAPGSLTTDEYLAITAFLAQAHGIWDGTPLDADRMKGIRMKALTDENGGEQQEAAAIGDNVVRPPSLFRRIYRAPMLLWSSTFITLLIAGGAWLWRRSQR